MQGAGHLNNLSLLLPGVDIRGIDRSEGQLETQRRRNPLFAEKVAVDDLTLPHPKTIEKADVVFAQAVLMHIQTGSGHRIALWNLFELAQKQVVLLENLGWHSLLDDIQSLYEEGILSWESMSLHKRTFGGGVEVVVASRAPEPHPVKRTDPDSVSRTRWLRDCRFRCVTDRSLENTEAVWGGVSPPSLSAPG
jgi:hypothetical protein